MVITGDPKEVASAYIAARKEIQTLLKKDGTGHSNRSYPTLANVLASVTDTLLAQGLVVMQETTSNEYGVGVSTTLLHVSGSSIDFAPLTMQPADLKPQTVGSTITYCRRYSLISALGLVGGKEDDDGEKGMGEKSIAKPTTNGVPAPMAGQATSYHDDELWEPRETVKAADPLSTVQATRIERLGLDVYGDAFAAEAERLALWASNQKINVIARLNAKQATALIAGLEKKLAEKVAA